MITSFEKKQVMKGNPERVNLVKIIQVAVNGRFCINPVINRKSWFLFVWWITKPADKNRSAFTNPCVTRWYKANL